MRTILPIAAKSLWSRRGTVLLSLLSVGLAVFLFLGVDKVRRAAAESLESTVSGTDLIVGARSGPVNLLLYSIFRIGDPTTNVSWEAYTDLRDRPGVAWTIPLSLGDSHADFRVVGTDASYLEHYRYGGDNALWIEEGSWFATPRQAVLGSAVAEQLGYGIGTEFPLSHGVLSASFANHEGHDFTVSGILAPTGTPVDRSIHVSLGGLEAVHGGDPDAEPDELSAFLVGLENRTAVLVFQRLVNTYAAEPLTAIIPGVTVQQLRSVSRSAEAALTVSAGFVILTGLVGLLVTILTSLDARRREIAVLRAAGAGAREIFSLLVLETTLVAIAGSILGALATYGTLAAVEPVLTARLGLPLTDLGIAPFDLLIVGGVIALAALLGLIPAWRAYRKSLADGLVVRF